MTSEEPQTLTTVQEDYGDRSEGVAAASNVKPIEDMSLQLITDGENERGIPIVKFIDDVQEFVETFTPPASAELLIGAYSQLHAKFKALEASFNQKRVTFQNKIPDIEQSLTLIKSLKAKKEKAEDEEESAITITRYNLCDQIYGKAEVDCSIGLVHLWLGANVMLEYTYEEAIEFLEQNEERAQKEYITVKENLAFVRDQLVTAEVGMTRIFNWDVRRKRIAGVADVANDRSSSLPQEVNVKTE